MFKRVFLVLTLLFAQSVSAQQVTVEQNALDENAQASSSPVVAFESATGSVEQDEPGLMAINVLVTPAEATTTETDISTSSLIVTGHGASSTSSTSTASTTVETEESTSTQVSNTDSKDKIFNLVFAGFEDFVEKVFGWE